MEQFREWCVEHYTIRSDIRTLEEIRHLLATHASDNPVLGIAAPLGSVMDALGFAGDRGGLTVDSAVYGFDWGMDFLTFSVADNFSDFDICRSLATHFSKDLDVNVQYRFSEGPFCAHESDVQHFVAMDPGTLREKIRDVVRETGRHFKMYGQQGDVECVSYIPLQRMRVDSFSWDGNKLNLVADPRFASSDGPQVKQLDLRDLDALILEKLYDSVNENFSRLAYMSSVEFELRRPLNDVAQDIPVDMEVERNVWLEQLYGSSSAYQNVSEYMEGLDLTFEKGKVKRNPSEEEVPLREPDKLTLRYGGEPLAVFVEVKPEIWESHYVSEAAAGFLKEDTGRDIKDLLGLDDRGRGRVAGSVLKERVEGLMLSKENREAVKQARLRCNRKMRTRSLFGRFKPGKNVNNRRPKV